MFDSIFETLDYELEGVNLDDLKQLCVEYKQAVDFNHDKQQWFDNIKQLCDKLGYATDNKAYKLNPENFKGNVAKACEYIRIALTTKKESPDLYSIITTLGKTKVMARLDKIISKLSNP
jgi:glutamyl-tRNA synthetase